MVLENLTEQEVKLILIGLEEIPLKLKESDFRVVLYNKITYQMSHPLLENEEKNKK